MKVIQAKMIIDTRELGRDSSVISQKNIYKRKAKSKFSLLSMLFILLAFLMVSCPEEAGLGTLSLNENAVLLATTTGEFEYNDILVPKQVETSQKPTWTKLSNFAQIEYSITPALPTGVSLDSSTGEIKVSTASQPYATKEHTVTAKNTGGSETVSTTIKITINDVNLITGTLVYPSSVDITVGIPKVITPTSKPTPEGNVSYSISPTKTGVSINSVTGVVTVSSNAVNIDGTYTVSATGRGGYGGTVTGTFTMRISNALPSFIYPDTSISVGTATTISPNPILTSGSATYRLETGSFPTGISIDANTGIITVGTNVRTMSATTYRILATSTKGGGSKVATAKIEVTTNTIDMSSYTLSYADTNVETGVAKTISPTTNIPTNVAIYTMPGQGAGIEINPTTGVISIAATARVVAETTFSVTATPKIAGYTNVKTTSIKLTIAPKNINSYQLVYGDAVTSYGSTKIVERSSTIPSTAEVKYTVDPALPTDIVMSSGVIYIGRSAAVQAQQTYTITATATNSQYTGEIKTTVKITVEKVNISSNTFSYTNIETTHGSALTRKPSQNFPSSADIRYTAVYGLPSGVTLNNLTGAISVSSSAPLFARSKYIIRATSNAGAYYEGTKDAEVWIGIIGIDISSNTFSYGVITSYVGVGKVVTPSNNFPIGANMRYSVSGGQFPTGITINTVTGAITVVPNVNVQTLTRYTIIAQPSNTNYTGRVVGIVEIAVERIPIGNNTFGYTDMITTSGNTITERPNQNFPIEANIVYSIAPNTDLLPTGVTLNVNTGAITIGTNALPQAAKTYTIRASASAGSSGVQTHEGTKDATVKITIRSP